MHHFNWYSHYPVEAVSLVPIFIEQKRLFHTARIKSSTRIGPHNIDVISFLVGTLLGDANLAKIDSNSNTTSYFVRFRQSIIHKEYIFISFIRFIAT